VKSLLNLSELFRGCYR